MTTMTTTTGTYARPQVEVKVHRMARIAALQRGLELRIFLSKIIPLGIQALEEQERLESEKLAS